VLGLDTPHDRIEGANSCHSGWQCGQNSILIVSGLEESIAQCDCVNPLHRRILDKVWIDEEEYWHVHSLPCIQSLFFKAKALNLAEIWSNLGRGNTIRCNSNDISFAIVCSSEEGQSSLTWQDPHFTLLRSKLPWQDV
jgi:hypothetical protein